jgi:hypothetical protein
MDLFGTPALALGFFGEYALHNTGKKSASIPI